MGVHKNSRTITVRLPMDVYFDVLRCSGERKLAVSNFALTVLSEAVNPEKLSSGARIGVYKPGYKEKVSGGYLLFIPDGKDYITIPKGLVSRVKAILAKENII